MQRVAPARAGWLSRCSRSACGLRRSRSRSRPRTPRGAHARQRPGRAGDARRPAAGPRARARAVRRATGRQADPGRRAARVPRTASGGAWHMTAARGPGEQRLPQGDGLRPGDGAAPAHARRHRGDREGLDAGRRGALEPATLWQKDFGGKFSRMRDAEVADLYGDGRREHRGRHARPGRGRGAAPARRAASRRSSSTAQPDTFVHEVEVGDLDGDGVLEVYATPSEPNRLDGSACSRARWCATCPRAARSARWSPTSAIATRRRSWSTDVDGDGRDELYVVGRGPRRRGQAARRSGRDPPLRRRHAARRGRVIATLHDRLTRFLTAGDVDGDGKQGAGGGGLQQRALAAAAAAPIRTALDASS